MKRQKKWSHDLRVTLYRMLVRSTGPNHDWVGSRIRPTGYKETCEEIALVLSLAEGKEFTWGAVDQQISFVTSRQTYLKSPCHRLTQIQNLVAAQEAGFIRTKDLSFLSGQQDATKKAQLTIGDVTYEFSLVSDSLQKKEKSS